MKSLTDFISESRTSTTEITSYIESWLKSPINDKEMYAVLGAIVEGAKNAYDYRTDPEYADNNDAKYKKADEVLKKFIEELK